MPPITYITGMTRRAQRPARPLSSKEFELLASFRYSLRQFLRFSEEEATRQGLTPQQHQALLAIRGFGDGAAMSVRDLATRLAIRHQTAVELVDRLSDLGLVRRTRDADDRRRMLLRLTAAGQRALDTLSTVHREELRRVGPELERLLRELSSPE